MNLPSTFAHPALRRGQLVEVFAGPSHVWMGTLAQPDINTDDDGRPTWSFTADGLSRTATGQNAYLALDGSGNTTSTPDTAIDAAIARGLKWSRPSSLSATGFTPSAGSGDQTDSFNRLGDLLSAWSQSVSLRWGVDENGNVYAAADPTTPTWHMVPGSGRFGLADDEYASDIYVRYFTSAGTYATVHVNDPVAAANYGVQEYPLDATGFGVLSSTQATGLGNGALAAGKARLGWTNSLSPTRWQLLTPGGTPAPLWMVEAQQMVRLHGVMNEQGQPLPYVDFVIGAADYSSAEDTLTISPVGLAARDLTSVIASFGTAA